MLEPLSVLRLRLSKHAGLLVAAATIISALVWAQFRGFDLLDTAAHFLTYQFPEDNPDTHTHYHRLARPLWLLVGGNIVAFRVLCLGLLSTAAWLFWRSWRTFLATPDNWAWAGLALWLATLAGLAWLPVLLGYNSLSTFFALLALAALGPALGLDSKYANLAWRHRLTCGVLFLVLVVLTGLAKPPAALALVVWAGVLSLAIMPLSRGWRLPLIISMALSAGAVILALNRWLSRTAEDLAAGIQIAGIQLRPIWLLENLQRYARELQAFLPALGQDLLFVIAPAFALAGLVVARSCGRAGGIWWSRFICSALLLCIVVLAACRGLWDGSFATAVSGEMARLYLALWGTLLPAWMVAWFRSPGGETRPGLVATAFFFLPLTCGFGSTNTLYYSALHWTVFWTAGLLIVSRSVARTLGEPRFHRWFTNVLILVAASHLFSGHFLHPYMHQPPLWRQNVPVAVGHPATILRLNDDTVRFLTEVRTTLDRHGYRPGDDVFGFFNLPGVIFAIGARQPGAPWYFGTWYSGYDTDGGKIRNVSEERRRRAWIITQADVTAFQREFKACGIDFPKAYEKIGQTTNPTTGLEIGIWKPKSRP